MHKKVICNFYRYDFMFDQELSPKLIELNYMSASMLGLMNNLYKTLSNTNLFKLDTKLNPDCAPDLNCFADMIMSAQFMFKHQ